MKIAVIGSGRMGQAFARLLIEHGYTVTLGCRSPQTAGVQVWSQLMGITIQDIPGAMAAADIILLALPYEAALELASTAAHLESKIVIDITNPVTPDLKGMVTGFSTSAAEQIQQLMPRCQVVKAFNTIIVALLPDTARQPGEVQTLVAGDDEAAKQKVIGLAQELGFDAVDAGELQVSRYIEPVAQMTIHLACFRDWGFTVSPSWKKISPRA